VEPLLAGKLFKAIRHDPSMFSQVFAANESVAWPNGPDLCPDVLIWGGVPPVECTATPLPLTNNPVRVPLWYYHSMETDEARTHREIGKVLEIVCDITGLTSNWNGVLMLVENAEFRGRKPFSCSIEVASDLVQTVDRWPTMIHEALHAVSAGYSSNDYQAFRGWEEGVVEKLQRLIRPIVISRLGISPEESIWQQRENLHPYNDYIDALEEVRKALGIAGDGDERQFYIRLLGIPIKDRPGLLLGMGYQRDKLPRTPFVRAFSAASAVLTRRPF